MNFSYWENKTLIGRPDVVVVGSGITGLSTAIHAKQKNPQAKVVILERGMMPWGASSKNAGFACFGSPGEILADIKRTSFEEVIALIRYRKEGLDTIMGLLGADHMDFQMHGGYELFQASQQEEYEECLGILDALNSELQADFGGNAFEKVENTFGFGHTANIIKCNFEGQIDTGLMISAYLKLAEKNGVQIFNGASVQSIEDLNHEVEVKLEGGMSFKAGKVVVCSNGFAKQFFDEDVQPARAQVLVTKPIDNLPWKGTFHYDQGYYYFRNIHNRILLGGGRNLDFKAEETTEMETSELIMNKLKDMLQEVILPGQKVEIDQTWAGIMGVGETKKPIVKNISPNVICGIRLGGMGVAIGTLVGKKCVELLD